MGEPQCIHGRASVHSWESSSAFVGELQCIHGRAPVHSWESLSAFVGELQCIHGRAPEQTWESHRADMGEPRSIRANTPGAFVECSDALAARLPCIRWKRRGFVTRFHCFSRVFQRASRPGVFPAGMRTKDTRDDVLPRVSGVLVRGKIPAFRARNAPVRSWPIGSAR